MSLSISSTSRDVSSIRQPKTRRLDEAYHRLQLLHLSQSLEGIRLLETIARNERKNEKGMSHTKELPFDVVVVLTSFLQAELQNSETWAVTFLSKQQKKPPVGNWCQPTRSESHP